MITNDYGVADRQTELLQMLKDIDRLLSKHGIQYSLCGGTLLGAVRHNGFIPWDDDLDIMFDRPNHEKLVKLFKDNNGILKHEKDSGSPGQGVDGFIMKRILWLYRIQRVGDQRDGLHAATADILVMDRCPDNPTVRKLKVLLVRILQGMMHEKIDWSKHSLPMNLCLATTFVIGKLFTKNFKFNLYQKVSQIGNNKTTQYITGYNDYFHLLTLQYSGKLMDKLEKHQFEDTLLPITAEYDNYLSTQYGDYMTPPEKKERVPLHL